MSVRPEVTPPSAPPAANCRTVAPAIRTKLEAALRPLYQPHLRPSVVQVNLTCDPLAETLHEVVIETGNGADGTLSLWRLTRAADHWSIVGASIYIGVQGCDAGYLSSDACLIRVGHAEASSAEVETVLPLVRAALLASMQDRPAGRGPLGSVLALSTSDVHRLVRLEDDEGRLLERTFTGYEDNGPGQVDRLAASQAAAPLLALLERVRLERRAPTEAESSLFASRYAAALQHRPAAWVEERLLKMAARLGTPDLLPSLVTLAQVPRDAAPDRRAVAAVNALAAITGWDARFDTEGQPRPLAEVAMAYETECR